jgi:hypothetical protein
MGPRWGGGGNRGASKLAHTCCCSCCCCCSCVLLPTPRWEHPVSPGGAIRLIQRLILLLSRWWWLWGRRRRRAWWWQRGWVPTAGGHQLQRCCFWLSHAVILTASHNVSIIYMHRCSSSIVVFERQHHAALQRQHHNTSHLMQPCHAHAYTHMHTC